jgi:hypothetical protein
MKLLEVALVFALTWTVGGVAFVHSRDQYEHSMNAGRSAARIHILSELNKRDFSKDCPEFKLENCVVDSGYVISGMPGSQNIFRIQGDALTVVAAINGDELISNSNGIGQDTVDELSKALLGTEIKPAP